MPYCGKCGTELPRGVLYCPNCGAPTRIPEEAKPERITPTRCVKCGEKLPKGASFCPVCGARVEKPAPPPALVQCPKCGEKLPKGAKFCPSCGARFTTEGKSLRNATLLAAIPGILLGILGLGHIYLGRVKRGVAFMVPGILLNIVMWIAYFQAPESAVGWLIVFIPVWVAHVLDVRRLWRRG